MHNSSITWVSGHVLKSPNNICFLHVSLGKFGLVSLDGFNTVSGHADLGNRLAPCQNVFRVTNVTSEYCVALSSSEFVLTFKIVESSSVWNETLECVLGGLNSE